MDIRTIKEKCGLNYLEISTSNSISDLTNSIKRTYCVDGDGWLEVCENLVIKGYFIFLINNERNKCNLVKWFNHNEDVNNLGGMVILSLSPCNLSKTKIEYLNNLLNQYMIAFLFNHM